MVGNVRVTKFWLKSYKEAAWCVYVFLREREHTLLLLRSVTWDADVMTRVLSALLDHKDVDDRTVSSEGPRSPNE